MNKEKYAHSSGKMSISTNEKKKKIYSSTEIHNQAHPYHIH